MDVGTPKFIFSHPENFNSMLTCWEVCESHFFYKINYLLTFHHQLTGENQQEHQVGL